MKKAGSIILATIILITLIVIVPFTANAKKFGDYVYTVTNGEAMITRYTGSESEILIPTNFDGIPVTSIGESAFERNDTLVNVTIPESINTIGRNAFQFCSSLATIKIPDSIIKVGYCAFEGTAWFRKQYDGVVYVGRVAYDVKGKCSPEVILREDTVEIAEFAFTNCNELNYISIPDSVINIGEMAFSDCRSLKGVSLGNNINGINGHTFWNCTSLESITLPNSITFIASNAFRNCDSIESITIPSSVTNIQGSSFSDCASLQNVTILNKNASLFAYDDPFYNCTELEVVYGYRNSTAEQYAMDKNVSFIPLDDEPIEPSTALPSEPATEPTTIPKRDMINGDIDGDGRVTISDALEIQRYLADYENLYHIGEPIE